MLYLTYFFRHIICRVKYTFIKFSLLMTTSAVAAGTNYIGFTKVDSTKSANTTWVIYSKEINLTTNGEVYLANDGDTIYISYKTMAGFTEMLSISYSTGSVLNLYQFNQYIGALRLRVISSAIYGYYAAWCTTINRLYYDPINTPQYIWSSTPDVTVVLGKK